MVASGGAIGAAITTGVDRNRTSNRPGNDRILCLTEPRLVVGQIATRAGGKFAHQRRQPAALANQNPIGTGHNPAEKLTGEQPHANFSRSPVSCRSDCGVRPFPG